MPLFGIVALCVSLFTRVAPLRAELSQAERDQVVQIVVKALEYQAGNLESLTDAEPDFTTKGWQQFMRWLTGWRDQAGAPTGTSKFTPTEPLLLKFDPKNQNQITISGSLQQSQGALTSSNYTVEVDVTRVVPPLKIDTFKVRFASSKK